MRAIKQLGQHFLIDESISSRIAQLALMHPEKQIVEIGPGTGALTKHLLNLEGRNLKLIEIDNRAVEYLTKNYPQVAPNILNIDFLKCNRSDLPSESFILCGNFPYNISSQIFFKLLEWRTDIPFAFGMVQHEVALRLSASHGNKDYGILSVLLQTYYDVKYQFEVAPQAFNPPPKVNSGVITLTRLPEPQFEFNHEWLRTVVKTAFNFRRKTLRNSLKSINFDATKLDSKWLGLRPEQLSVADFATFATLLHRLKL